MHCPEHVQHLSVHLNITMARPLGGIVLPEVNFQRKKKKKKTRGILQSR
jgi:hypothetical protein